MQQLYLQQIIGGATVDLGIAYARDTPRVGDVVVHATPHGDWWRVVLVRYQLIADGSPRWSDWQYGRDPGPDLVDLFVEAVETAVELGDLNATEVTPMGSGMSRVSR